VISFRQTNRVLVLPTEYMFLEGVYKSLAILTWAKQWPDCAHYSCVQC